MKLNIYQDDLYRNQTRNQARSLAKTAMEDTIGQASAMTGGYANSYAQIVGQQEYARVLDSLSSADFDVEDIEIDNDLYQNMLNGYINPDEQQSEISDEYKNKASTFQSNDELAEYLDILEMDGKITSDQADALFADYRQPDKVSLSQRDWKLVDDGGINWFGGIDRNASVKDQYGNTYDLIKLKKALIADDMDESEAKDYVEKLQTLLGA